MVPIQSKSAKRKYIYRVKQRMPKDPSRYGAIIEGLILKSTPRKRGISVEKRRKLDFSTIIENECTMQTLSKLKSKRDK